MKRATFAAAAAALALVPATLGQSLAPPSVPVTQIKRARYDLVTGTTSALRPGGQASTSNVVFDNAAVNGFAYAVNNGEYAQDTGTLSAQAHNCITDVEIGYGTSSATPVDMKVRFHANASGCGATPGTLVAELDLTGLPASDGVNLVGWTVSIDLEAAGACFELPDGDIGWSYEATDGVTGPLTVGPPVETGVGDFFAVYDSSNDTLLSCSWFGGTPYASFYLRLTGHQSSSTFGAACSGAGGFLPELSLSGCACEGGSIAITLAKAQGGAGAAMLISPTTGSAPLPNCTLDIGFPAPIFVILGVLPGSGAGNGGLTLNGAIPAGQAGITVYAQCVIKDSTAGLITSNGLAIHVAP